ncbi:MAG: sulfate adenylyltransferase, partial [Deltaproteobacteria bacterium]|nr:sulfate adenylyltransferase [Deltaproteobacteria bacterium]
MTSTKEAMLMSLLVPPHGGALKPLLLDGEALVEARGRAATLPRIR